MVSSGCREMEKLGGAHSTRRTAIIDKGYDSRTNRAAARARGITPVIPRKVDLKERGRFFPKTLYKLRVRIEQTMGKLKRFKRIALRDGKTTASYTAFISFACSMMLIKSVHAAYGREGQSRIGLREGRA
jgi:transposase